MLRLVVDPVHVSVSGDPQEIAWLSHEISFSPKDGRFNPSFRRRDKFGKRKWDGRTRLLRGDKFRTGLLQRVIDASRRDGIDLEIEDQHIPLDVEPIPDELVSPKFTPFPFQSGAVDAILKWQRMIVWAPAGVGKTGVAIEFYRRTGATPFFVVVRGRALLHQTVAAFREFLPGVRVGMAGDGRVELDAEVIVATQQTLASAFDILVLKNERLEPRNALPEIRVAADHHPAIREKWMNARAVVFDEAHHCATPTVLGLAENLFRVNYVVGLTATPWEEDQRDMVIESVVGPIGYHMTVEEGIELGRVVPANVTVFRLPHRDLICGDNYQSIYKAAVIDDLWYHDLVASVANQLRSKGHKVAVLVTNIDHGKLLQARIPTSNWIHGKSDENDRRRAFHAVVEEGAVLVSNVLNEGVDIPGLTAVLIADPKGSRIMAIQRPTRGARVADGKLEAVVVMFQHRVKYLEKHTKATVNAMRNESAYTVWERTIHDDGTISTAKRLGTTTRWGSRKIRIHNVSVVRGIQPGARDAASSGRPEGSGDPDAGKRGRQSTPRKRAPKRAAAVSNESA